MRCIFVLRGGGGEGSACHDYGGRDHPLIRIDGYLVIGPKVIGPKKIILFSVLGLDNDR